MNLSEKFARDILLNKYNAAILESLDQLALKDAWLVAGCLFQTVWNVLAQTAPESNIKDYDIFYFDPHDLSEEGEILQQRKADEILGNLGVKIEVKNQARVHLWYREYFGYDYPRSHSAKDGIDRFLMVEVCLGVSVSSGNLEIYAPNGVHGVYSGRLTPNPLTNHADLFDEKFNSYQRRWAWLSRNDI
ncbi:nucleotidyltransferase family protein [Herbaspirillum huttiense]|uniref:nucleotidyltransferase family protein n=1 Tax=Herbaspirillum huttiense TaxID=863372 RepID=UPI002176B57E|nr:nucleotidyltransferase family protein [Herbaspirillum huttiense]UWE18457.1 nucleotidyltransferase family protein [Herbaspirillum huttiense]